MRIAVLILPMLLGCATPLAGYVHVYQPIDSALGRSDIAEAYARLEELERLKHRDLRDGYPPRGPRGVQPCRKALAGPKCTRASR